jgi:hypothetical protein
MSSAAPNIRRVLLWARLVGLAGAVCTLVGLAIFLSLNPFDGSWPINSQAQRRLLTALALFALLALVGVLVPWRRPLISAVILLIALAGSLTAKSWYFLLVPYVPVNLIGIGSVLYLIAIAVMVAAVLAGSRRDDEG